MHILSYWDQREHRCSLCATVAHWAGQSRIPRLGGSAPNSLNSWQQFKVSLDRTLKPESSVLSVKRLSVHTNFPKGNKVFIIIFITTTTSDII